jgi:two-component system chemotaxis response regulator CheB
MMEAQADEADAMLWSLLRAHQQRAEFTRRMAEREKARDKHDLARQLGERAQDYQTDAEVIERILESRRVAVAGNGSTTETGNDSPAR